MIKKQNIKERGAGSKAAAADKNIFTFLQTSQADKAGRGPT